MTKPVEQPTEPTLTDAQVEAFKQQQRARVEAGIKALLEKYNCDLVATPQIVRGVIVAGIDIINK